jgi:hypothetical protein
MATTDELRVLNGCQFGHAILIHGINLVFVDHSDLVSYNFGGSRTGRLGLKREGLSWRHAIDMRRSTILDNPVDFTIDDYTGDLARLFGSTDSSERSLGDVPIGAGRPIDPNDSLAARVSLWSKNIGTERIGPAGERNLYPSPSGGGFPLRHSIAVPGLDLAGAPVSDNPIVWAGRRVTLYRIYRDHILFPSTSAGVSSWRPFAEAKVLWWGAMRDEGKVSGRTWTLTADGAESWLRKPLAVGYQTTPVRAIGDITLATTDGAREDGIAVQLATNTPGAVAVQYGGRGFVTALSSATTVDGIRDLVISEIAAAAAAATDWLGSASSVWDNTAGYHVTMSADGSVTIGVPDVGTDTGGFLSICLHRKVWSALGYDVALQPTLDQGSEGPRFVKFRPAGLATLFTSAMPGPNYYVGVFSTWAEAWLDSGGMDNGGEARVYEPQYKGGTNVLLASLGDGAGQIVRLAEAALGAGAAQSTVAHPGQLDRPVASDPANSSAAISISGTACNRQGLWLFYGKRRMDSSETIFDEYQIGRASWVNGTVQQDGLVGGDTIIVTEWLRPRRFGFERDPLQSDWVALASAITPADGMIQAIPICTLGWRESDFYDLAHIVAQRLLYSTGTSTGWTGFSSDATASIDAGDNEPAGDHTITRDAERTELGLAIPAAFIQPPQAWKTEADKVENADVLDVKIAFGGGYQSVDALRSLLQPVGWSWHLRGGRYGIWCPADPLTLADATVVLTRTQKAAPYGAGGRRSTTQDLRKWQPVDKWIYDYSYAPLKNATSARIEMLSPDSGLRYRPGEVTEQVMAHGMRMPRGVAERVLLLSQFWGRRHFEVRGWPVHAVFPGEDCWPGTIVRITDPELIDVLGSYGVTSKIGVITGCTTTLGPDECSKTLDILVFATNSNLPRLHAPSARATEYNSTTRVLTVQSNWLGIENAGDNWADSSQFAEPLYTGVAQFGGVAQVQVSQWDGASWSVTLTGTVSSVTSTTITLSAATGTYLRDQDAIVTLRESSNQTAGAYPYAIYSPINDAAGQHVNPSAATVDGFVWEP